MQSHRLALRKLIVITPSIKSNTSNSITSVRQQTLHANMRSVTSTAHGESVCLARTRGRVGNRLETLAVDGGVVAAHVEDSEASEVALEEAARVVSCVGGLVSTGQRDVGDADGEELLVAQRGGDGDAAVVRSLGAPGSQIGLNGLPSLVLL